MPSKLEQYKEIRDDEFRLLFQHNLFSMLKIFSKENPIRKFARKGEYDSSEEIQDKIAQVFNFRSPAAPPPHEYYINLNLNKEVATLADLNKYIEELQRKVGNYSIAMVAGESFEQVLDKFLIRVNSFLTARGLGSHISDVVAGVATLVKSANFNEEQRINFYRSLANSKLGKQRFYDMLSNTCAEFIKGQTFDELFIERAKCECPYEETDSCDKYPRKSLALHFAHEKLDTLNVGRYAVALSVDRCVVSGAAYHYWIQILD